MSKPSAAAGKAAGACRRPPARAGSPKLPGRRRAGTAAASLASDALAWAEEFGTAKDVSGLSAERNVFRYRALPVLVRLSDGEPLADLVRTVAAGVLAGSALTVSTGVELPARLRTVLSGLGIDVTVENDADWLASAGRLAGAAKLPTSRIRLIGGDARALAEATGDAPTWRSTSTRSPKPDALNCCRSCTSRPSASRRTASAPRTTSRTD